MINSILGKSYLKVLGLYTVFCFTFLFVRNVVAGDGHYNFLVWNLFLGFVPFLIALYISLVFKKMPEWATICLVFIWLVFYPNAPYMITDFIHVEAASTIVLYEALMIFSFSMLSLFFGFYSIKLIESVMLVNLSSVIVRLVTLLIILTSSLGIYLGRVLRLNSWDLFTHFGETMHKIFEHLFPITKNPETYTIIVLFAFIQWVLLNLMQDIDE